MPVHPKRNDQLKLSRRVGFNIGIFLYFHPQYKNREQANKRNEKKKNPPDKTIRSALDITARATKSHHHFAIHQRIRRGRDGRAVLTANAYGKLMIRAHRPELDQWPRQNQYTSGDSQQVPTPPGVTAKNKSCNVFCCKTQFKNDCVRPLRLLYACSTISMRVRALTMNTGDRLGLCWPVNISVYPFGST